MTAGVTISSIRVTNQVQKIEGNFDFYALISVLQMRKETSGRVDGLIEFFPSLIGLRPWSAESSYHFGGKKSESAWGEGASPTIKLKTLERKKVKRGSASKRGNTQMERTDTESDQDSEVESA